MVQCVVPDGLGSEVMEEKRVTAHFQMQIAFVVSRRYLRAFHSFYEPSHRENQTSERAVTSKIDSLDIARSIERQLGESNNLEVTISAMDLPPAYEASASFWIKVHFKQSASLTKAGDNLPCSPLWARLLGIAVSREWLHSSGIFSTYQVLITTQTTFHDFDNKIRDRLRDGGHGPPIRWLSWRYVLRGRWLGAGDNKQTIVLDEASWESGKVAMQAMLDVRIDMVFDFMSEERGRRRKKIVLPPPYSTSENTKESVRQEALPGEDMRAGVERLRTKTTNVEVKKSRSVRNRRQLLMMPFVP